MPALKVYTSNNLANLAQRLAGVVESPLSSPTEPEVILVQSRGMERWVAMELARLHGVWANCRFPFPNTFLKELFAHVVPEYPASNLFEPAIMAWKIMSLLPTLIERTGFEALKHYVGSGRGTLRPYQLCRRIADVFDQYLVFRPDMIFRWEKGEERHWQAQLWREMTRDETAFHRARLARTFVEAVAKEGLKGNRGVPERISLFGISALPRFHMEILARIARFVPVHMFLLNPCREYWGDILSDSEIRRTVTKSPCASVPVDNLHLDRGNPLLSSMGALGREFFDLIYEFECEEFPDFVEPEEHSVLALVQSDILHLREPDGAPPTGGTVNPLDRSIQAHSCHSPMREMEVLQDHLLQMFENDPGLNPRDILVMTPDIENYAPYVQAVFDLPPEDPRRIPYSIADRGARKESEVIDAFLSLLDLAGGRFGSSQVLALLDRKILRDAFGLEQTDVAAVRRWVRETRIRWGIDRENRTELGLPALEENTWKSGLDRLLLGYAMPGKPMRMFKQILPYDSVEGSDSAVLGKFAEFAGRVFEEVRDLTRPRNLSDWSITLTGLLDRLFAPDDRAQPHMAHLRAMLNGLKELRFISGFEGEASLDSVRAHIREQLERGGVGSGFITGGITFCSMLPMRSIPFKAICLAGLNHDAYPRESRKAGFDLIAKNPRKGDRSRRNDDRYLFLETLLSARKTLYISYVGQSIRDNSLLPPSVLVSELLDYLKQRLGLHEFPVIRHRLQAFSPSYFQGDRTLFSYSQENARTALAMTEKGKAPRVFLTEPLEEPDDACTEVDLEDLCSFFANPTRHLILRRLGISLTERFIGMEEKEPFELAGLDAYLLAQELLERRLSGEDLGPLQEALRASGRLPHGSVGRCAFENLTAEVEAFAGEIESLVGARELEPLPLDVSLGRFQIRGLLSGITEENLARIRYARANAADRIGLWIRHALLNLIRPEGYPRTSMLIGRGPRQSSARRVVLEYGPLEDAEKILEQLLEVYWKGLREPIHFFPDSSWTFARESLIRQTPPGEALEKAGKVWRGSIYDPAGGEREDPYYELCFGEEDPLDEAFCRLSLSVFFPPLGAQKDPAC